MRVIFESGDSKFRIVEHADMDVDLDNLKGDTYNPKWNTSVSPSTLKREEIEFEEEVSREGVFGYGLQKWNPAPGKGWEHMDSCYGFVGQYSETTQRYNHYIVAEMMSAILKE